MKLDQVAGSKNDENYTPRYAVEPIVKYIPACSVVWCPFDTEQSYFVKELRESGCEVSHTHIENGEDFFETQPPLGTDYIISNPPYSLKGDVLQRLFNLNIPFAMLVGVVGLFESKKRFEMFKNNDFEIMYLDKRVSFFLNFNDEKPRLNPPFSSVYVCRGVLPKQIVFEKINKQ